MLQRLAPGFWADVGGGACGAWPLRRWEPVALAPVVLGAPAVLDALERLATVVFSAIACSGWYRGLQRPR